MIFRIITEIKFSSQYLQLQIFSLYKERKLFISPDFKISLTFQFDHTVIYPETL